MNKKYLVGIIVLAILLVVSIAIAAFSSLNLGESLRIVFGSVYVLFLPGFIITYIFFKKIQEFDSGEKQKGERESGSIDWIERIALSFALSIAIVPLAVFYLNLIGLKINMLNSFLVVLGIIIISVIILKIKQKKKK